MPNEQEENNDLQPVKIKPKRKHIIDAMLFIEATSTKNACHLEQIGLDLSLYDSRIKYLIKNKAIIPVSDEEKDSYYLDYDFYQIFREQENKRFFITIVSIVIPGVLFLLLGVAWLIMSIV